MREQLLNTLYSVSATYQRNISSDDYEVIVVENRSSNTLSEDDIRALPDNFRYFLHDRVFPSPASAINFGIDKAGSDFIGLMIDGAHLLSPSVMQYAIMGYQMDSEAFIVVPVYHLGEQEQHISVSNGYSVERQNELLAGADWKNHGYNLFQISTLCQANPRGVFAPIMESNCYFASKSAFAEIGFADESFQQPGGGGLNLHITRKLGTRDGSAYMILASEGSFHQYHGGVTSNKNREDYVDDFYAELQSHWNNQYRFLQRNPIVLGAINSAAITTLMESCDKMQKRFHNCRKHGWEIWPDEPTYV